MIKILKYSSLIVVFFVTGCLFTEPINEKVSSGFNYSGEFLVNKPVVLEYSDIDEKASDITLRWQIEKVPLYSVMEENSFLPSNDITKRVFIPDVPGNYVVSLSVEGKYHAKSKTTKTIRIKNNLPVAIIKSLNGIRDFVVYRKLSFDASNSYDIDYNKIISFKWSILSAPKGSAVKRDESSDKKFVITPDLPGSYTIKLLVEDINEEFNYTTYSFYVHDEENPKILRTIPDNNIKLIPIRENEIKKLDFVVTDKTTDNSKLKYIWEISTDNNNFFLLSNSRALNFNGSNYGIGDLIYIKLTIINLLNKSSEVLWKFVIVK